MKTTANDLPNVGLEDAVLLCLPDPADECPDMTKASRSNLSRCHRIRTLRQLYRVGIEKL